MPKDSISKINTETTAQEATVLMASKIVVWNKLMCAMEERMSVLRKNGGVPAWADQDNVYAMGIVALLQRWSVQLQLARDTQPECFDLAMNLYESFGLSDEMACSLAEFLLANVIVREAVMDRLREITCLPWEYN